MPNSVGCVPVADARYVIDVSAQMSGTETLGELDSLADKLAVGGKKSEDFQQAIKRVTADLDAAKTAASQAAAALAVGNDEYRVLERAATSAAKAVERANAKGRIDLGAAREAGLAQAKLDAYTVSLRGLEKASADASAKQAVLAKQVANVSKLGAHADQRYQALNQRFEKMGQAVQFLPGPLGRVAGSFIMAQRAGHGLLNTLGATRAALLLTSIGALAAVGAFAALSYTILKRIPGADDQIEQLGKNVKDLFKGLNWEPLQAALGVIVGMFDKANPLAEVLRIVGTAAFNGLSEAILSAAYLVEAFALEVAIAAVKAYLFFKKYGDEIIAVVEGIGIALAVFGVVWAVMNAGVLVGLAAQAVAWVVAGAAAAGAWLAMALPVIAVIAAIASVGYAIGQLILHWDEVVEGVQLIWSDLTAWLGEQVTWFTELGANLMAGLVAGITGAVGSVISAVSGAVTGAIDAAKSVLGIASPSKVFAEIGGYTAEGFTSGVDDGAGAAQGSMAAMVDPAPAANSAGNAAGAASGGGASGGKKSLDMAGATFNFYGVKDAETHGRSMLAEAFTALLEGDADSMGGGVPA